jgi:hypothetical protein
MSGLGSEEKWTKKYGSMNPKNPLFGCYKNWFKFMLRLEKSENPQLLKVYHHIKENIILIR